jgi:hypothetical protein
MSGNEKSRLKQRKLAMRPQADGAPARKKNPDDLMISKYRPRAKKSERDKVMQDIFSRTGYSAVIARHIGVTRQYVSAWKRVPAHYVLKLAPLLEKTPQQIRPDIFGAPKPQRRKS